MTDPLREDLAAQRVHRVLDGPKPPVNPLARMIPPATPTITAGDPQAERSAWLLRLRLARMWALKALGLAAPTGWARRGFKKRR